MSRFNPMFFLFIATLIFPRWGNAANVAPSSSHSVTEKRVIALTWSSAEALLALGVTPVGVADPQGYRDWVQWPSMPNTVINIGTRSEPNLELIHTLKPDLIVAGPALHDILSATVDANVLILDTFRADHTNSKAIDEDFLKLAHAIGKTKQAEHVLQQRAQAIQGWKQQLEQHFSGHLPKVTIVHFLSTTTAAVYGQNSSVEYALTQLGIDAAMPTSSTAWGQTPLPIQQLTAVGSHVLIYIRPFADEKKLFSSILWQHMPFVKQNHFLAIEPSWTFGSALSIKRLAQVTAQALLTLDTP